MKKLLISIVFYVSLAFVPPVSADYSAGMTAYMNNDFELAQTQWLEAAELKDAKAMFNLGLLHERRRVAGANETSADKWFRLAGQSGYAPADYHLAHRLKQRGVADEAEQLLRRAADAGFLLAQEQLGGNFQSHNTVMPSDARLAEIGQNQSEKAQPVLPAEQQPDGNVGQESVAPRKYQGEGWVLSQSSDAWTIQMLAFSDEAKVRNFIDDHGLHRNAAYFLDRSQAVPLYKLIYGAYDSKEGADEARAGFTSQLKEHGPWLRPIKAVQATINGG